MIMPVKASRSINLVGLLKTQIKTAGEKFQQHRNLFMIYALLALFAITNSPTFAQNAVGLDIQLDPVFSQTNYWTAQLFPIMSIGIGISIAMALIAFIGSAIVKAFRGG